jgi:hypothetical protein
LLIADCAIHSAIADSAIAKFTDFGNGNASIMNAPIIDPQ